MTYVDMLKTIFQCLFKALEIQSKNSRKEWGYEEGGYLS